MAKLVNKLFLIGNGFDLALGLKTSYSDFLLWLLKKEVIRAIESDVSYAPFPKYKGQYDGFLEEDTKFKVNGFAENKLFDILIKYSSSTKQRIDEILSLKDFFKYVEKYSIQIIPNDTNILTKKILETSKTNWVDIESIYFESIKEIINRKKSNNRTYHNSQIDTLNDELTILADYLKEYLKSLELIITQTEATPYFEQFDKKADNTDFLDFEKHEQLNFTKSNYFLNFNYTDSLSQVLAHFPSFEYRQIFIHGSLEDDNIVFGFGDEMDPIYKEIEELNDNRFFKHIKSFHYFKSDRQRRLQTFLNSGEYQVCVYGHSCGLSDRVMLNEIFEHENCKSILIYYYNDEDFTTKTMEISRHFNNNQIMRKKIVNKSTDCLIPQIIRP